MGKKENLWQRFVAILMTLLLVLSTLSPMQVQAAYNPQTLKDGDKSLDLRFWEDQKPDTGFYLNATSKYILETVPKPVNGSTGGEWAVLGLLRGMYTGYDFINSIPAMYFTDYIARNEEYVVKTIGANKDGHMHSAKSTEYSRLMLTLSALGYDVRNVGTVEKKYDFLERLSHSHAYSYKQGINGPIWETIALNTGNYPLYTAEQLGLMSEEQADVALAEAGITLAQLAATLKELATNVKTKQAEKDVAETALAAIQQQLGEAVEGADTTATTQEIEKQTATVEALAVELSELLNKQQELTTAQASKNTNTFGKMMDYTLGKQLTNGGWTLSGTAADPDMTGMALQSLAPYYLDQAKYESIGASQSYEEFEASVERGVKVLAELQLANGGYSSSGTTNPESISQVIVALTALNIDPLAASIFLPTINETVTFIKNGDSATEVPTNNMIDALLTFFVLDSSSTAGVGGFKHIITSSVNQMASEQALYALVAYERFKDNKSSLYNMLDMTNGEYKMMKAATYTAKIGATEVQYSPYAIIDLPVAEEQVGKIFKGWNTKENGSGISYNTGEKLVMPKHDITLYAQYDVDPNYAVTQVMDQITALPAHIQFTEEHKLALNAARVAYDALTEAQQELVTNYSELVEKENAYKATEESANTTVPLVSISFKDSEIGVLKDQTYQAEVIFNPANTTDDKTITWSSNKSYLISVDQNGVITPKTAGSATITAKTANGLTATMQVKTLIPLTDFNLDKTEYQINQSLAQTISTKFTPANTSDDKTITWSSSDENIATVDAKGNVTAVNLGTATITAKVGAFTRTATVKVIPYNPITSVTVSTEEVELDRGQTTTITTTYAPLDTTDSTVAKWSSSNSSVASVSQQGVITANARGTASITVKIGNISKKITVNVNDEVKGTVYVSFEDYAARVEGGEEFPEPLGTLIEKTAVPFYEGDSIADVTVRLLDQLGIIANYQGDTKDSFYLSSITDFTTPAGDYITGHNFGEFTAGQMSGWMISSNNWFINMGASAFEVEDGDIIRWQMTSQYGADIGSSYDNPSAEITGLNIDLKYGTLSPAFSEDKEEYTLTVPADVDAIQIETLQSNYWSIVTYTADGKQYKLLRDIPVEDGTEIEIYSAYAEYAGNPPSDEDSVKITIVKEEKTVIDEALQNVIDKITALPTLIAYEETHKLALDAARVAYEALNETQKMLVANYQTLVQKENAYKALKEIEDAKVPLTAISVDESAITLTVGDTHTAKVAFLPENTTDSKTLEYETSDASVVRVENGVLTAVAPGQATVTVKAANEVTATITVTVQSKPAIPTSPVVDEALQNTVNKINALPTLIKYEETHKLALDEARVAYNALNEAQQMLVTNYAMLVQKEAAYQALVEQATKPTETRPVQGYVYMSFEDFGVRVAGEDVDYPTPLGMMINRTRVPFYAGDTIADVTVRLLEDNGMVPDYWGTTKAGFYLATIDNVPYNGSTIDGFGEFSAGPNSGWMISWNNWYINMGASQFLVEDGDIVKWQYTSQLGVDIGSDVSNPVATITGLNIASKYGQLSPNFTAGVKDYTLSVPKGTTAIQVEALQANYWAMVTYKANGQTYKVLRDIPVQAGTVIEVISEYKEYVEDPSPQDTDKIRITIAVEGEKPAPEKPVVDEVLQNVINKINALPMVITLDEAHKQALEEARASYNALSDVQKLLVSNYDVLQLKENAYGLLVEAVEKPEVPEEKPEVPEEKPEVPEEKPEVPEEKPDVPEEKPVVPEEKPEVPEEKPVVPNVIPETPNDTGSVPVSPTNPAPTPVVPEEKPAVFPAEMSKTEGKQQATVNQATNPGAAVVTVQSAEGIQISIPKAAFQTESVDVVLQVAKQGLQINFEVQGQAVSLKKHVAIAIPAEVLSPKDGAVLLRRLPDGSLAAAPYTVVNGEFVLKTATSGEFVVSTASKTFKDIKNDGHKFYIEELAKRHIVNGKADEVYDPKEGVTRGQFSAMIVRAIDLQAGNEQQFSDAKANQFAQELQALVEIGVLKGDGNQLKPGATVTRHQAALMMERLFKHLEIDLPEVSDEELNFSDAEKIPEGSKQSIALMQKLGIFTGKDDGRFDPNGQLTRSQMSKVIYKALTYAEMM